MTIPERPWLCYLISAGERIGLTRWQTEEGANLWGEAQIELGKCGGYEVEYDPKFPRREADVQNTV